MLSISVAYLGHKVEYYTRASRGLVDVKGAQLIRVLNLTALGLDNVVICSHLCNFYEVWIASSCYVADASTPRKTAKKRTRMSQ